MHHRLQATFAILKSNLIKILIGCRVGLFKELLFFMGSLVLSFVLVCDWDI